MYLKKKQQKFSQNSFNFNNDKPRNNNLWDVYQ